MFECWMVVVHCLWQHYQHYWQETVGDRETIASEWYPLYTALYTRRPDTALPLYNRKEATLILIIVIIIK